jgi:hypothetical protein
MNMKVILAVVLGVVLGAVLVLAVIGLYSLRGDGDQLAQVEAAFADEGLPAPEAAPAKPAGTPAASRVAINGRALTAGQIQEMLETYGVKPAPGSYWYDARSGMYGVIGMAPAGFMLPGHDFGPLPADASRGNSGVFINGRNIPQEEHLLLNLIWNTYIQPGAYWLDAYGNVGYEGSDYPIANLLVQLQAISQAGGGSVGGDNIWSSRYSAGNYTADNSAGYVSVPGYGPVGYGN